MNRRSFLFLPSLAALPLVGKWFGEKPRHPGLAKFTPIGGPPVVYFDGMEPADLSEGLSAPSAPPAPESPREYLVPEDPYPTLNWHPFEYVPQIEGPLYPPPLLGVLLESGKTGEVRRIRLLNYSPGYVVEMVLMENVIIGEVMYPVADNAERMTYVRRATRSEIEAGAPQYCDLAP